MRGEKMRRHGRGKIYYFFKALVDLLAIGFSGIGEPSSIV
jgi:hypothetical protein